MIDAGKISFASNISFSDNAFLDIGGTFTATTADSILFDDGSEFSAVNPNNPILTISLPTGVQLGSDPQPIAINGSGSGIFLNEFHEPDLSAKAFGLSSFGTINLIGGEINLDGGQISTNTDTLFMP